MTNTKLLRDTVKKSGLKYKYIAETIGLTPFGLQKKIENDNEFKASEIKMLCCVLDLSVQEKEEIFFAN